MQFKPIRETLLAVDRLSVEFRTRTGTVRALENISVDIQTGEIVGIVGESGSGKSVLAFAIMGILDRAGKITSGRILFDGTDLLKIKRSQLRQKRGKELSMICQNPRAALNPIRKIGRQIEDVLQAHTNLASKQRRERALELLSLVRIGDPSRRYCAYPDELSGGMCQRVTIALALACSPRLAIADEPTTGLDVTTQAAVMDLIVELATKTHMATLLITHDLEIAAQYCDRLIVMHAGHIVETAKTADLFQHPRHPYTAKLIAATPAPEKDLAHLVPIPGNLPDLRGELPLCRFRHRCDRASSQCDEIPLEQKLIGNNHLVTCQHPFE
ncbi:MAG: ABC transporter ATP-binding protein [Cyanobacteria bacterium SBLK]|nr:ABC transporter ATP-binding protein [Cyanobacteria bacterium SBLK]